MAQITVECEDALFIAQCMTDYAGVLERSGHIAVGRVVGRMAGGVVEAVHMTQAEQSKIHIVKD